MNVRARLTGRRGVAPDTVLDRFDLASARKGSGQTVRSGVRWLGVSNIASQATRIASTIVLARLLSPAHFGLVALVMIITGFFQRVLGNTGMSAALSRTPELTQRLASSIFWFNVMVGVVTMTVFLVAGHLIALLLGEPDATNIVRVLGCMSLLSALSYAPISMLRRAANFKSLAVIKYTEAFITAVASIALAFAGWEEWALVIGALIGTAAWVVAIWIAVPWRPALCFSRATLKPISNYSLNVSLNNLFGYFTDAGDRFIVGRLLGTAELGFYGMANRLLRYPLQLSIQTYREVMSPTLARLQEDPTEVGNVYLRSVSGIAFVLLPLTVAISVLAGPLVLAVLGDKWEPAIPLVSLIALVGALQALTMTTASVLLVMGKSNVLFRWGVASAIVTMAFYSVGALWDVEGVAAAYLAAIAVLTYPSFWLSLREIGVPVSRLLRMLLPTAIATAIAAVAMLGARFGVEAAGGEAAAQLVAGLAAGAVVYGGYAVLLEPDAYGDLLGVARARRGRRDRQGPAQSENGQDPLVP